MSVRVSPISRTAALLIIIIGAFTLFTGVVADIPANDVAGVGIVVLGLALYGLLFRFSRKVNREISEAEKA